MNNCIAFHEVGVLGSFGWRYIFQGHYSSKTESELSGNFQMFMYFDGKHLIPYCGPIIPLEHSFQHTCMLICQIMALLFLIIRIKNISRVKPSKNDHLLLLHFPSNHISWKLFYYMYISTFKTLIIYCIPCTTHGVCKLIKLKTAHPESDCISMLLLRERSLGFSA